MLIDILIPAYNEAASLAELIERISLSIQQVRVCKSAIRDDLVFDYRIYIADNLSSDNTPRVVRELQTLYPGKISYIRNKRNYGYELSVWNLMQLSRGDAVVHILSDLEDPPELVGRLIELWLCNHETVDSYLAAKYPDPNEPLYYVFGRRLFYFFSNLFLSARLPTGYHGVGIYSSCVIRDAVWLFGRSSLNIRTCLGTCIDSCQVINYAKSKRKHGKSSLGLRSNASLAIESIFKQDKVYHLLIKLIFLASLALFSMCLIFIFLNQLFNGVYPSGTLTLATISIATAIPVTLSIFLLSSQISSIPKARRIPRIRYDRID